MAPNTAIPTTFIITTSIIHIRTIRTGCFGLFLIFLIILYEQFGGTTCSSNSNKDINNYNHHLQKSFVDDSENQESRTSSSSITTSNLDIINSNRRSILMMMMLPSDRRNRKKSSSPNRIGNNSTFIHKNQHNQCKTIETTMQVSKEDKSSTGDLLRVCEGIIVVNKCEGACLSNLRPSINTITGLFKVSE